MRKVLIATAAVTLAAAFAGPSYAAPAKSEYCKLMNAQRNPVGWSAYYHCDNVAAAPAKTRVVARATKRPAKAKSPYCAMASAQRNPVVWNEYYHCR
jgi:hypothetical protein